MEENSSNIPLTAETQPEPPVREDLPPEESRDEPAEEVREDQAEPKKRKKRGEPRKVSIFFAVFLALLLCGATFFATYSVMGKQKEAEVASWKSRLSRFSKLEGILDTIDASYVRGSEESELMEDACRAVFENLDSYSFYMSSEEYDAFVSGRGGSYAGIGVSVTYEPETQGMYIYRVVPDSPAETAGMRTGMIITGVEDTAVTAETYQKAIGLVAGEEGTAVALTVLDGDKTQKIEVVRGKVESRSVWYSNLGNGIGLIEIDEFSSSNVVRQFKNALQSLKDDGCKGCVFDLRGNPGGDLNVITSVLDMLLPEGPIVHITVNGETRRTISSTDEARKVQMPMAVLCNGNTASAAELFTADLRDYGLASIVGETTHGKGTVQSIFRNADGSAYKLTTSYYTPASGTGYDGTGIVPDFEITLSDDPNTNRFLIPRSSDRQLQKAVELLTGGQAGQTE